jgi:hypothetical protein
MVASAMSVLPDAQPNCNGKNCHGVIASGLSPEANPAKFAKADPDDDFGNAGDLKKAIKDFCATL